MVSIEYSIDIITIHGVISKMYTLTTCKKSSTFEHKKKKPIGFKFSLISNLKFIVGQKYYASNPDHKF